MNTTDLCFAPATTLVRLIRQKKISPVDVVRAVLDRIERIPISFRVDTREFIRAVKAPSVKGLRVAWSPDLGIAPVEREVKQVAETAVKVFARLGARVEDGHPDFSMANYIDWVLPTYAFTVVGLPAISVPAGWTADGLPVGLQIVGRWRGEASVLRAAPAFETASPWADKIPAV